MWGVGGVEGGLVIVRMKGRRSGGLCVGSRQV